MTAHFVRILSDFEMVPEAGLEPARPVRAGGF